MSTESAVRLKGGRRVIAALAAATLGAGCAIHQNVTPFAGHDGTQICAIENNAVRFDFLESLRKAVAARGYTVRQLPPGAALRECPVTLTYTANWRWDMAMYMAYAEIRVYKDGAPAGQAVYDAMAGGANLSKFISADEKIRELVVALLPPVPR